MPELGHLRTFVAVARERNFTRAGRRLHLGQQAVSKSIATLEAQLGVPLLRRTTRDVSLTAAGEALLRSGSDALARVDAAFAEAAAYGQAPRGTIRVGVTPAVGTAAHPGIAAALTADAPGLHITFRELRPPEAGEMLRRRELDLVISRDGLRDVDGVGHAELPPSPAIAIVARGHRLAACERITVAELDGETLDAWADAGNPYTDELRRRLRGGGADVAVSVPSVIGGSGPPTLTDDAFALRPRGWPVSGSVALELEPPGLTLPLWVHWPLGTAQPAVQRLRDNLS